MDTQSQSYSHLIAAIASGSISTRHHFLLDSCLVGSTLVAVVTVVAVVAVVDVVAVAVAAVAVAVAVTVAAVAFSSAPLRYSCSLPSTPT